MLPITSKNAWISSYFLTDNFQPAWDNLKFTGLSGERSTFGYSSVHIWKEKSTPHENGSKKSGGSFGFKLDFFEEKKLEKNASSCLQALCFLKTHF